MWGEPQPGPQTQFDDCHADIAVYGGAAGGGKSVGGLWVVGKWTQLSEVRGYRGICFRRTNPELVGGGGLWDKSQRMYRGFGGRPRAGQSLDWVFEAASGKIEDRHRIEFRHLQHESDVYDHHGLDYAVIFFDELQTFTAKQFWYMLSRLRSTSGVRPHMRGTCNPDPDSFVAELVEWWIGPDGYPIPERSGVIRWFVRDEETDALDWYDTEAAARAAHPHRKALSFTFIAAKLSDNPALVEDDPDYRSRIEAMSKVDRLRLLGDRDAQGRDRGGNWRVRAGAGLFFARAKFQLVDKAPSQIVRAVRFWDRAYTKPTAKHPEPDWTEGSRWALCAGGEYYWEDQISMRDGPGPVLSALRAAADADGLEVTPGTFVETGFAGKTDRATIEATLEGYEVAFIETMSIDVSREGVVGTRSSRAKRALARAWVPHLERARVYVKRAPWNERALRQLDAFPNGKFDDIVDSASGAIHVLGADRATSMEEAMAAVSGV